MNRKELIEWLEAFNSNATRKMKECESRADWKSFNYQLGKATAFRRVITKLEEQEESEAGE